MELRCQNCGERIVAHPKGNEQEVVCPACGVTMLVRPTTNAPKPRRVRFNLDAVPRPTEKTWRRVFEPIPKPALYIAGSLVALVLLSPFWVYLIQERYTRNPIFLSEDTTNIVRSASSTTNATTPVFDANAPAPIMLDQFRGVRLETGREELQRRFNLRLQNTRGMEPEIYEANRSGDIERITAYFYSGVLKEAALVLREQRGAPDIAQKELVEQFGPTSAQTDGPNRSAGSSSGLTAPSLAGGDTTDELMRKINAYPFRRDLLWINDRFRVQATVYYTSVDPAQGTVLLSVNLSAAAWLRLNQPMGSGTVLPPPLPLLPPSAGPTITSPGDRKP